MSKIDWNDFLVHNGYDYDPGTDLYTNLITGKRMACLTAVREKMGSGSGFMGAIGTMGGWLGGTKKTEEAYNQALEQQQPQLMMAGFLGQQQAVQISPGVLTGGGGGGGGLGPNVLYTTTGGTNTALASTGTNVVFGWKDPYALPHKIVGQCHTVCVGVDFISLWWDGKRWTTEWEDVEPLIVKEAIKGDSGVTADELEEAKKIIEELSSGKEAQV